MKSSHKRGSSDINASISTPFTVLSHVIKQGSLDEVRRLCKQHGKSLLKHSDKDGKTPLHIACSAGKIDIARYIITKKASIDSIDSLGMTPLLEAASNYHLEVCSFLIEKGANFSIVPPNTKHTVLHYLSEVWDQQLTPPLISSCSSLVNTINNNGMTPSHIASNQGLIEVVKLLVMCNADLDIQNFSGETPLHLAARAGHKDLVKVLLDCGCDPKIKGSNGTYLDVKEQSENGNSEENHQEKIDGEIEHFAMELEQGHPVENPNEIEEKIEENSEITVLSESNNFDSQWGSENEITAIPTNLENASSPPNSSEFSYKKKLPPVPHTHIDSDIGVDTPSLASSPPTLAFSKEKRQSLTPSIVARSEELRRSVKQVALDGVKKYIGEPATSILESVLSGDSSDTSSINNNNRNENDLHSEEADTEKKPTGFFARLISKKNFSLILNKELIPVLRDKLIKSRFPPINGSTDSPIGIVSYEVSGLMLSSLVMDPNTSFKLTDQGLIVNLNISAQIKDIHWKYATSHVKDEGTASAEIQGGVLSFVFGLSTSIGFIPQVVIKKSHIDLGHLSLDVTKSKASWIYNKVISVLSNKIKSHIQTILNTNLSSQCGHFEEQFNNLSHKLWSGIQNTITGKKKMKKNKYNDDDDLSDFENQPVLERKTNYHHEKLTKEILQVKLEIKKTKLEIIKTQMPKITKNKKCFHYTPKSDVPFQCILIDLDIIPSIETLRAYFIEELSLDPNPHFRLKFKDKEGTFITITKSTTISQIIEYATEIHVYE